jgi:zinc protease
MMTGPGTAEGGAAKLDRSQPPTSGPLRPFRFPDVERRTLSNGMTALIAPVHNFPVVTLSVILEAGAMQDSPPLPGVAALTAALLESGTERRTVAEIAEEVEGLGVHLDTSAGWDSAQASLSALASVLEPATEILADVVRRPSFPQAEVERLRAERLAEILQRRADPRALAGEAASRFIFAPESRASLPHIGTAASLEQTTRQDISLFHAQHYSPLEASVVVAGDVDADAAMSLLESVFSDWVGGRPDRSAAQVHPRTDSAQVIIVDRPGSVQSEIRVGHLGVSRSTEDYFPLVIMNAILGGMFSSRLNLNLRERHGYTYGVSSGFAARRDPGPFLVSTAVQTEVTADAIAEVMRELRAIREAPVAPEELEAARNYFAGVFPLQLQTTSGIAGRLTELLVYGLPDDYFDTYRDRILAVTGEAVHQAALRYVRPHEVAVVAVGDAAAIRASLEALDLGPVQVVAPEELQAL